MKNLFEMAAISKADDWRLKACEGPPIRATVMHFAISDSGLENSKAELCRRIKLLRVVTPTGDEIPRPVMEGTVKSWLGFGVVGTW